ncbi:sensor histidine kinase [Dictyobacter kobayashii]|uniref:sensor histidine kinase n=1 Tax=Dictyobacter kobayashii TaxID=2014872 RepID=UPI0035312D9E
MKYSPQGGPITITMAQRRTDNKYSSIEIAIADHGIGVPLQAQQHLFERFYRAPNIGNSQARGVGLGLYVVAEFLRLHSGSIEVASSGIEGEGSCFTVRLPLLEKNR